MTPSRRGCAGYGAAQAGALRALPMGYLIAGRIGTGKTFSSNAGPASSASRAWCSRISATAGWARPSRTSRRSSPSCAPLGQVVVFVDEADQAAGKREGGDDDSGLSGRVYSMLAKEMSDTRNRGRIIWVFATSRPDLLEVDLKRQGRLDVHIPLFPPQTPEETQALLLAIAKKLKFPLTAGDLPPFAEGQALGGNEIEGVLVRALRLHELSEEPRRPIREILADVLKEVRPSPHTRKLEYMDLVAVKECTDARFLPPQFRGWVPEPLRQEPRVGALLHRDEIHVFELARVRARPHFLQNVGKDLTERARLLTEFVQSQRADEDPFDLVAAETTCHR